MTRVIGVKNIDDYLGPSEDRFFGSGYRRADYSHGVVQQLDDGLHGNTSISYPGDWSKKKAGVDLRPHLSTVDTMILGVEYTELLLASSLGLKPSQRRSARIEKVVIQAGTEPEESLESVPVEAQVLKSKDLGDGLIETTTRIQIGRMRIRLVVRHERGAGVEGEQFSDLELGAALEPAASRYWGSGFRSGRQLIGPVTADVGALSARAGLRLDPLPDPVVSGLGGRPHGPTPVDAFVSVLQLAQVLLYEMDGLTRVDSSTLWMQRVTVEFVEGNTDTGEVTVTITESQLVDLPDGRWRNVTFSGAAGQYALRCLFAHRLP